MNPNTEELADADVPVLAVAALNEAQRRAMESGHTVVFVRGDQLIEKSEQGERVLKTLPPRRVVTVQTIHVLS